ncbi:MAG TPA: hypothetical protein ENH30_01500 [Nitrospirae bacterium]|nr:hypothetical protein [Nitrospirota bacterium]
MTPDEKVYRAMVNLENDPSFEVIKQWIIKRAGENAIDALETDNDTRSKKLAGRALEGKEIIEHFDEAREVYDRLRAEDNGS